MDTTGQLVSSCWFMHPWSNRNLDSNEDSTSNRSSQILPWTPSQKIRMKHRLNDVVTLFVPQDALMSSKNTVSPPKTEQTQKRIIWFKQHHWAHAGLFPVVLNSSVESGQGRTRKGKVFASAELNAVLLILYHGAMFTWTSVCVSWWKWTFFFQLPW